MPADPAKKSWREALLVYRNPCVLAMLFLGFSAGLPFLLIFSTLSVWLREADISRTEIGFFSWIGIMFSIKVVWAPIVDRTPLPVLTAMLGRRRSWMLLAQAGIAAGLLAIATSDPTADVSRVALCALFVAFCAATQDISIDAYRIEAVAKELQGAMAATYQLGYRLALLAAGAGALYIADFVSWPVAYAAMAGCMLVGMATVLVIREPKVEVRQETRDREARLARTLEARAHASPRLERAIEWVSSAVVSPFADFFVRNGRIALAILALIALYRISDITMGIMANPLYVDLGFTKSEIATASKTVGIPLTIFGAFLGGFLVARFGLFKPLLLGALMTVVTNLAFAYLSVSEPAFKLLLMTVSADNLAGGLAGSVFIAYLSSLTNTAYTATQYALFSSLFTLAGKFLGGFSGIIVDATSYQAFFIYAAALGLPAILLVLFLMFREARAAPVEQTT
jgi:MFS transporter, PAT family, beta-lactamase induction signal transducer AmpG